MVIVRNVEFVEKVDTIIYVNPRKSMRAIANQLRVSESKIKRVFARRSQMQIKRRQATFSSTRENHVKQSNTLLNKILS